MAAGHSRGVHRSSAGEGGPAADGAGSPGGAGTAPAGRASDGTDGAPVGGVAVGGVAVGGARAGGARAGGNIRPADRSRGDLRRPERPAATVARTVDEPSGMTAMVRHSTR